MIKVNNKMLERFLDIIEDYGEYIFGSKAYLKKQLELCLNSQGYWSGCAIRIYYNKDTDEFSIENRF